MQTSPHHSTGTSTEPLLIPEELFLPNKAQWLETFDCRSKGRLPLYVPLDSRVWINEDIFLILS